MKPWCELRPPRRARGASSSGRRSRDAEWQSHGSPAGLTLLLAFAPAGPRVNRGQEEMLVVNRKTDLGCVGEMVVKAARSADEIERQRHLSRPGPGQWTPASRRDRSGHILKPLVPRWLLDPHEIPGARSPLSPGVGRASSEDRGELWPAGSLEAPALRLDEVEDAPNVREAGPAVIPGDPLGRFSEHAEPGGRRCRRTPRWSGVHLQAGCSPSGGPHGAEAQERRWTVGAVGVPPAGLDEPVKAQPCTVHHAALGGRVFRGPFGPIGA